MYITPVSGSRKVIPREDSESAELKVPLSIEPLNDAASDDEIMNADDAWLSKPSSEFSEEQNKNFHKFSKFSNFFHSFSKQDQ